MKQEDKIKEYRQAVLAKINEKAKIKAQKKLEEKAQLAKESLEMDNKEIARLKKKFPNEKLATLEIADNDKIYSYELPLLESSRLARQRIYEKYDNKFPTRYGYLKKQRHEWYLKMKKAGIKRKKRKYHIMPKDLSVHTHDKCRVPVWPILTMQRRKQWKQQ